MESDADWTLSYFDPPYEQLHPFPGATQTDAEIAALLTLLPSTPCRIIDIGCGPGRHAVRLARRGYDVVGIDTSRPFLAAARSAAAATDQIKFVELDARELDFVAEFDVALSLFTSWGYFDDDTNRDVLARAAQALRPGGLFVLDVMSRDALVRVFKSKDWVQLADGQFVVIDRTLDVVTGVNIVTNRWTTAAGDLVERQHRIRSYTATEVDQLLRSVGLKPRAWYGGFSLEPLTYESHRLLVVAERAP